MRWIGFQTGKLDGIGWKWRDNWMCMGPRQAVFNLNCSSGPIELRENLGFSWPEVNPLARSLQTHVQPLANSGGQAAVRSRQRPPVRTVSAAVVPKRGRLLSATPLLSHILKSVCCSAQFVEAWSDGHSSGFRWWLVEERCSLRPHPSCGWKCSGAVAGQIRRNQLGR